MQGRGAGEPLTLPQSVRRRRWHRLNRRIEEEGGAAKNVSESNGALSAAFYGSGWGPPSLLHLALFHSVPDGAFYGLITTLSLLSKSIDRGDEMRLSTLPAHFHDKEQRRARGANDGQHSSLRPDEVDSFLDRERRCY